MLYLVNSILLGAIIYSIATPFLAINSLTISHQTEETIEEDQYSFINVFINNKSKKPIFFFSFMDIQDPVFITEIETSKLLVELIEPYQTIKHRYKIKAEKRGIYTIGPSKLEFNSFLGLFPVRKTINNNSKLIIFPNAPLPKKLPVLANNSKQDDFIGLSTYKGESYDFVGISTATCDDGIKKIHWPLTAKCGELMIKTFKKPATGSISILIDNNKNLNFGKGKETVLEASIKICTSLVNFAFNKKIPVKIFSINDKSVISTQNKNGYLPLYDCLFFLSALEERGNLTLMEFMEKIPQDLLFNDAVFLITPQKEDVEFFRGAFNFFFVINVLSESFKEGTNLEELQKNKPQFYDAVYSKGDEITGLFSQP